MKTKRTLSTKIEEWEKAPKKLKQSESTAWKLTRKSRQGNPELQRHTKVSRNKIDHFLELHYFPRPKFHSRVVVTYKLTIFRVRFSLGPMVPEKEPQPGKVFAGRCSSPCSPTISLLGSRTHSLCCGNTYPNIFCQYPPAPHTPGHPGFRIGTFWPSSLSSDFRSPLRSTCKLQPPSPDPNGHVFHRLLATLAGLQVTT